MGRLIDIDRLCDDLMKRWSIADKKKEDLIRAVMADVVTPIVVSQPTVEAIPLTYLTSRIAEFRAKDTYANQFAADFLQAIINEYNKEKDNDKTE